MKEKNKTVAIQILTEQEFKIARQQTNLFINALLSKDLSLLESLLHEKFVYFDNKTKWQTLDYFKEQFSKSIPFELISEEVGFFYCTGCQPGNPALLIHNGYWPVSNEEENLQKSLMLCFTEGLISDLTFCYGYCNANRIKELIKLN